ncbi:ABC transporter permease [Micromonospora sp. NPDC049580]|uniref:ABC transporter permease n=1 Tax=Micromonospora sp. NPDC049580 TaxID=3154832 RepID=UPI00344066B3
MTAPASTYPRSVEQLLPDARNLATRLGELPSRNRLMRELRIGAPKAEEVRDALIAEHVRELAESAPAEPAPDPWDLAEPTRFEPGFSSADDDVNRDLGPHRVEPVSAPPATMSTPVETRVSEPTNPTPAGSEPATTSEAIVQVGVDGHPGTAAESKPRRQLVVWPVILLALPAFVAIWSGWVGLGGLAGFGVVHPLPGIWDDFSINSAITLPIGVETYGAYASYVWLSGRASVQLLTFAKWSAIASLLIGALGQVAYHLLVAAGVTSAPWQITTAVACLPVAVFGMGAGLAHLVREDGKR